MTDSVELRGGALEPAVSATAVVPTDLLFSQGIEVSATTLTGDATAITPTDLLFSGRAEFAASEQMELPVTTTDLLFYGRLEIPATVYQLSAEEMAVIVAAVWADPIAVAANARLDAALERCPG